MTTKEQIIRPFAPSIGASLSGLWEYRRLLVYFSVRAIRLRYKETILGWLWLVIRPLVAALLFTLVFGKLAGMPSDGLPYLVFFFSAYVVWTFFQNTLIFVTRSLRSNRRFITRIYFPRIIVPVASMAPFAIELAINVVLLALVLAYFYFADGVLYVSVGPNLFALIGYLFLALMLIIGIGLWTTVLNAEARDVRFTMPYALQAWFFATPVLYPVSLVPEEWRWALPLNPLLPVIEGFRSSLTGVGGVPLSYTVTSSVVVVLALLSGLWFFSKAEMRFADAL